MFDPNVQFQSLPFWDISLGNLLVLAGILIQGLLLYAKSNRQHGENKEKLAEISRWKEGHDLDAKQRDRAIVELGRLASGMKATADAMQNNFNVMQRQLEELIRRDHTSRRQDRG